MRYLLIAIFGLMLVGNVFAKELTIIIKDEKGSIIKEEVITAEEVKAVEYYVVDFSQWIIDAVKNKAKSRIDAFIQEHTDKNVNKISEQEKLDLVTNTMVKSRIEREQEKTQ